MQKPPKVRRRELPVWGEVLLLVLIAATGVTRIVSTFDDLNQTLDEPAHIATGMEWLDHGRYQIEHLHPPLSRIAAAAGPYFLLGLRLPEDGGMVEMGNRILYESDNYFATLSAARWGLIPFFLLGVFIVWIWARETSGRAAALWAALLFSLLPEVLGHAGLATTDMAGAATLIAAFYTLDRWIRRPAWKSAVPAGLAVAAALLSKLSAVLFLPLGLLLIAGVAAWRHRRHFWRWLKVVVRGVAASGMLLVIAAGLLLWSGYRFSVAPVAEVDLRLDRGLEHLHGESRMGDLLQWIGREIPLPAPEFFAGIHRVRMYNAIGHNAYLLGEVSSDGWWYFYPVAFLVKTPIAFLVFVILGVVLTRRRDSRAVVPLLLALLILLVSCTARLNLGLRYILPVYPLLSIVGGAGLALLMRSVRGRVAGAALILWLVFASLLAHPDYIAYFNEPARPFDDRILLDSNLDWGQDLVRLGRRLEERGADEVALSYFGTAHPASHIQASIHPLHLGVFTRGLVAISEMNLKGIGFGLEPGPNGAPTDGFDWLEAFGPPEMIGHSIRLYDIAPDEALEPLLVPFWFPNGLETGDGLRWVTRLSVPDELPLYATAAAHPAWRVDLAQPGARLPEENLLSGLTLFTSSASPTEAVVTVSRKRGSEVVQRFVLPVVSESSMRERFDFPGFSSEDERIVVRVWALDWKDQMQALIRISSSGGVSYEEKLELRRQSLPAPWIAPLYAEITLASRPSDDSVLTVEMIDGRGWATAFPENSTGTLRAVQPRDQSSTTGSASRSSN